MTKTIGELLSQLKIEHKVPGNHEVLAIPLSTIQEYDYIDTLTVIWLYGEGWINPAHVPEIMDDDGPTLGSYSNDDVQIFYNQVYAEIERNYALLDTPAEMPTLSITSKPSKRSWLNPLQVTHWLTDFPPFLGLLDSLQKNSTQAVAESTPEPTPGKKTVRFNPEIQIVEFNVEDEPEEEIDFNRTTLETMYTQLGITLPDNPSEDLASILQINLINLNDEQIAELTFYTFLFVFKWAEIEGMLTYCTYADEKLTKKLHEVAKAKSTLLLSYFNSQMKLSNEQLIRDINKELKDHQIEMHPKLLMVLCFNNCPLLKDLFIQSWNAYFNLPIAFQKKTFALYPDKNPFLFGRTLCLEGNRQLIPTSNHDLCTIYKLKELTKTSPSQKNTFFTSASSSSQSSANSSAFFQDKFSLIRTTIKDPTLRQLITVEQLKNYMLLPILNYSALAEFIMEYGINKKNDLPLPTEKAQYFCALFDLTQVGTLDLHSTIDCLAATKLFIDINKIDKLWEQKNIISQTLEQLTQDETENQWIQVQRVIWLRFQFLLDEKIHQLAAEQEAAETLLSF